MRRIATPLLVLFATVSATACNNEGPVNPSAIQAPAPVALDIERTRDGDANQPFSFAVIGDTPYGVAKRAELPLLVQKINSDQSVRLVAHLGDLKAGKNIPCTNAYFEDVKSVFEAPATSGQGFNVPFVFTPGDNEWADCHVAIKNNGAFTPTERLQYIRQLFFPVPGLTLGHHPRLVLTEALDPAYRDFVENVMWMDAGVVFVTVNITGSNNDIAWWGDPATSLSADYASYPSQQQEVETRARANTAWIDRAFLAARLIHARGLVLISQADPWDTTEPDYIDYNQVPYTKLTGFDGLIQQIGTRAASFGQPVLLLEGDSHRYKTDNPFSASSPLHGLHAGTPVAENITRIVVEGELGRTEYLRVTVDPRNPAGLFTWERVPLF